MLNSFTVNVKIGDIKCEVFISPFLLQAKKIPDDIKSGKLTKLYFYYQLRDDGYVANLEQEILDDKFKSDQFIINYGQDFEKHYLGSLCVDFDNKRYWQWEGANTLSEDDVKSLGDSLFNPELQSRVTLFTPTRPSDFNFGIIRPNI
ncbi:MAG TPA: hypothetical protein VIM89_03035 [Mucilaginibacter sp.]